ncbi:MAG: PHB depolymerase family esterase [Psychromonas sp.]|nr:PHB depolymerase family esterase [Psychromonas sp.]
MRILKQVISLFLTLSLSFSTLANFTELQSFGANPGSLEASYFTPQPQSSALVVLLHGCAQNGEQLAQQSGLLGLAKQQKFALLVPQQGLSNNIKRCFNWYSADDYTKDQGESLSIKNMITTLQKQILAEKIYIIGLSAGGAMTSSMLVNYPDLFTAGAVVAGIPFPCADGLITAISCMKNGPSQTVAELVSLTKKINLEQKEWPKLSVWTGDADEIVNPLNSSSLAKQWAKLLRITTKPTVFDKAGYTISQWKNTKHQVQVELVKVIKRGHGIMVNPNEENGGEVSDYLLASSVSTVKHVARFWEITQ